MESDRESRMSGRHLRIACLALLLGACSGLTVMELPRAELRTDRSSYAVGEEGTLTLENTGPRTIYHGAFPCFASIEERADGTWTEVDQFGDVCTLPLLSTAPGDAREAEFTADGLFAPGGTYRFAFGIQYDDLEDGEIIRSNAFTVTE